MQTSVDVSPLDLPFVADQLAQVEVLVTFLIDSIRTAKDFPSFQTSLTEQLKQVKVTRTINVEDWLKDQKEGFVALVRPVFNDDEKWRDDFNEAHPVDYWRDEEAFPIIFKNAGDPYSPKNIPEDYCVVRVLNLAEQHEN